MSSNPIQATYKGIQKPAITGTGRMITCIVCAGKGWTARIGTTTPYECQACKGTGEQEVQRA